MIQQRLKRVKASVICPIGIQIYSQTQWGILCCQLKMMIKFLNAILSEQIANHPFEDIGN